MRGRVLFSPFFYSLPEDVKINGPLVAEMFNILGFHLTSKSTSEDDIMKFYRRDKTEDELRERRFHLFIFLNPPLYGLIVRTLSKVN